MLTGLSTKKAAAASAGATETRGVVRMIANPKWQASLESIGYTKTVIEKVGEFGVEGVWLIVLPMGGRAMTG
jgi:hypothetical protein